MQLQKLQDVFSRLPVRGETAFSNSRGKFQDKIKKQQLKYLSNYVDDLKHILEKGEEILLASRAVSPFNSLEQVTTGAWIYQIKRCLLVLTDRRLLHFPSGYRFRPRDSVAQIRFQDIDQFKGKRRITFRYKNGTKEFFSRIRNGKRLVQLLRKSVATSSTSSQHGGRQHLCPRCVAPLPKDRYTCPRCRLEFKEPGTAVLYSVFLPGGGYFYTRHPWLGLGDAVTELVLIFITFIFILDYFTSPQGNLAGLYVGLAAGAVLTVEKLISVYHVKRFIREFIPVEKRFNRIPQEGQTDRPSVVVYGDEYEDEKVSFY
jgi:hypothetical protein